MSAFVRKRGQATNFWCWSKKGSPCLGKEGAGGQYGEVVTNIALFVTHGVQYHRIVWPYPSRSFEVYSGQCCLWAQAPHLEVQAARLTMRDATRLFKIRGFPSSVFFFFIFSLQYLSQNVADQYQYHELGNLLGDNARYVQRAFSRSVTDNCKRLKARTAFVMSNCNELLSFEREMKWATVAAARKRWVDSFESSNC